MVRKRRNAYLSAIVIFAGVFLIGWGTFLPSVSVSSAVGFSGFHLSLKPTGSVGDSSTQLIVLTMGFFTMVVAFLLALAMRPGWGLAWRASAIVCLIIPVIVVLDLWDLVSNPGDIPGDNNANIPATALGYVAKIPVLGSAISASPGSGLWLMSFGCVVVLIGAALPAVKSRQIVVRDDDPRFQAVVNVLQQFAPQTCPPASEAQSYYHPPTAYDPSRFGSSRYYGG